MYSPFVPLLEWLQGDLARRLNRDVDIYLRIFKNYERGLDALAQGEVDLGRSAR